MMSIILNKVQYKQILDVSVSFSLRSLTAIMGSSGSGKTTMLNLLSGRIKPSSGNVYIPKHMKLGYVMQRDMLTETDTVLESLMFAISIQSPHLSRETMIANVDSIIDGLGLQNVKDSIIGSFKENDRGLSGGEKKRVAIAQILVSNPDILILDEPTSGLDSITAEHVIQCLYDLTKTGMTVICTIHQPSSTLFQQFDNLVLLANGNVVFAGQRSKSIEYFANMGYVCPIYNNPADYYIHILATDDALKNLTNDTHIEIDDDDDTNIYTIKPIAKVYEQFILHVKRLTRKVWRDPYVMKYRVLQNIGISLIYGSLFWSSHTRDKLGAIFYMILYQGVIFSYMTSISSFPSEVSIIMREQLLYPYDIIPYITAKTIVEFPLSVLYALIFVLITNFMIGLNNDVVSFIQFLFISILLSLVGQTWGYVSPALFHSLEIINAVTPIMTPFIIMGGYFTVNIPVGAIWLYDISFIRWSFQSMVEVTLDDNCNAINRSEVCIVLDEYNIQSGVFWRATLILISQFIILRTIVIGALYYRKLYENRSQE